MTLSSVPAKEIKNGNDATTVFSFTFVINSAADMVVTHTDALGVETIVTEGTGTNNYSISVAAYPGNGSVSYPAALGTELETGAKLTLARVVDLDQETDLQNQAQYKPETVEAAFDYSRMVDLQQQDQIDRSIKAPISDNSGADYTLPAPVANASLGAWNATGDAIVAGPTVSEISGAGASAVEAAASAAAALISQDAVAADLVLTNADVVSTASNLAASQAVLDSAFFRDTKPLTNADSPYALLATDSGLFFSVDTSAGDVVVDLAAISTLTLPFNIRVKKETGDGNVVTINCAGTDTFGDGLTVKTVSSVGGLDLIGEDDTAPDQWKTASFGAAIGQMVVDGFSEGAGFTAGTSTTLALSQAAGSENNGVLTFDGLTIHHDDYSIVDTTLTYTGDATIPLGTLKAEFRYGATTPIGTPADNTVTTAKISSGAATDGQILTADGIGGVSYETLSSLGRIINIQGFAASGTYTRSAGVTKALVIMVGATGGGSASSSNNGTAGGNTALGALLSCLGGLGGTLKTIDSSMTPAATGVPTGALAEIGKKAGGAGASGYDGGGQWRLAQAGGGAPTIVAYVTVGATETVTIGAAGSGGAAGFEAGEDGEAGSILIIELA
tara:strand:+ start:5954 stop:7801 length:1848 start_codon:yes stop_codon:yes gene_type:complete